MKLADIELSLLQSNCDKMIREPSSTLLEAHIAQDVTSIIAELRAHRAARLTKEEVDALHVTRLWIAGSPPPGITASEVKRAVSVLDKLLASHGDQR